jgi:hypothetical protein
MVVLPDAQDDVEMIRLGLINRLVHISWYCAQLLPWPHFMWRMWRGGPYPTSVSSLLYLCVHKASQAVTKICGGGMSPPTP